MITEKVNQDNFQETLVELFFSSTTSTKDLRKKMSEFLGIHVNNIFVKYKKESGQLVLSMIVWFFIDSQKCLLRGCFWNKDKAEIICTTPPIQTVDFSKLPIPMQKYPSICTGLYGVKEDTVSYILGLMKDQIEWTNNFK